MVAVALKGRDFLRVNDWSPEHTCSPSSTSPIGSRARRREGVEHRHLEGRTLGMIFREALDATRVSFEVGMFQLGGTALCHVEGFSSARPVSVSSPPVTVFSVIIIIYPHATQAQFEPSRP